MRTASCLLIMCLFICHAYGQEATSLDNYIRYLRVSGLKSQIKQIPKALFGSLPADAFADAITKHKVERLFFAKINSDEWVSLAVTDIANAVDSKTVEEVIRFYSSPLGRKLATAQEVSLNLWIFQQLRESYTRLSRLSETRLALLKGLAETCDLERFNVEAVDVVVRGLLDGYEGQSGMTGLTREDTEETLQHSNKIALRRTGELCLISLANSLASSSDQDLADISSFLRSDACRQIEKAYRKALRHTLYDAAHALGESMREAAASGSDSPSSQQ